MRKSSKKWSLVPPAIALAVGGAASASGGDQPRALALDVIESGDSVELELIAHSEVTQQVQYSIELIGNSTARHRGDTRIAAGERQVLSRLKSGVGEIWCATVHVTEASGAHYVLTAGDCT
ncbi:MAG: curli-like amyloid fiber formation chaperone CsgH [Erythrobacter sp.]